MKKLLTTFAILLFSTAAWAQSPGFEQADANADGAVSMEEAKAASAASGIDTFIAKPVKIDEVRHCLDEFLPA